MSASLIHGVVTYERYSEPAQVIQLPVPQHEFSEEGQVLAERIQETTEMLLSFLKDLYAKVDRLEKDVRGR